jgi:hypothetical protein
MLDGRPNVTEDNAARDGRLDSIDRIGRVLLGVGGCLSAGFFVVIAVGLILLTLLLLIGMGTESTARDAGSESLAIMGGIVVLALVFLVAWWLGLKGNRVALALLVPAGLLLAFLTTNAYLGFQSGLDRAGDVQFLLFFMAAVAAPLSMALGAGLRLGSLLLRPRAR